MHKVFTISHHTELAAWSWYTTTTSIGSTTATRTLSTGLVGIGNGLDATAVCRPLLKGGTSSIKVSTTMRIIIPSITSMIDVEDYLLWPVIICVADCLWSWSPVFCLLLYMSFLFILANILNSGVYLLAIYIYKYTLTKMYICLSRIRFFEVLKLNYLLVFLDTDFFLYFDKVLN